MTVAVRTVPSLSSLMSFACPSTKNWRPGWTSKSRYSPFGTILQTSRLPWTQATSPLIDDVVTSGAPAANFEVVLCCACSVAAVARTVAAEAIARRILIFLLLRWLSFREDMHGRTRGHPAISACRDVETTRGFDRRSRMALRRRAWPLRVDVPSWRSSHQLVR